VRVTRSRFAARYFAAEDVSAPAAVHAGEAVALRGAPAPVRRRRVRDPRTR